LIAKSEAVEETGSKFIASIIKMRIPIFLPVAVIPPTSQHL